MCEFVDFEGTVAANVIRVNLFLITNTGTVFPGSASSPKKHQSAWTSGMPASSSSLRWGISFPVPLTQWRHQLLQVK